MLQASRVSLAERSSTTCSIVSGYACGSNTPTCSTGCTASRTGNSCPDSSNAWECTSSSPTPTPDPVTTCSLVSGSTCGSDTPTCSAGCTPSRSGSGCPSGDGFWQCNLSEPTPAPTPACTDKQACFGSCSGQAFSCYQDCENNCPEPTTTTAAPTTTTAAPATTACCAGQCSTYGQSCCSTNPCWYAYAGTQYCYTSSHPACGKR